MANSLDDISSGANASSGTPMPGKWAQSWSDPAREAIESHVASGGSIGSTGLTGRELKEMIASRLAAGEKAPGLSTTSERLAGLRDTLGNRPGMPDLQALWAADPKRLVFSGAPIAAGLGAAAYGEDEMEDPRRLIARQLAFKGSY